MRKRSGLTPTVSEGAAWGSRPEKDGHHERIAEQHSHRKGSSICRTFGDPDYAVLLQAIS